MDSLSDTTSDSYAYGYDFALERIHSSIDLIGFWNNRLITSRHDGQLGGLSDTLEGRIWLEKVSQTEGGLRLCLREFQLVRDALYSGSAPEDQAPKQIGYINRSKESCQKRINTLCTVTNFLFEECLEFQIIAERARETYVEKQAKLIARWKVLERRIQRCTQDLKSSTTDTNKQSEAQQLSQEVTEFLRDWRRLAPMIDDRTEIEETIRDYQAAREEKQRNGKAASATQGRENKGRGPQPELPSPIIHAEADGIRVFPGPPRSDPSIPAPIPQPQLQSHPPRTNPEGQRNATHAGTRIPKPEYRSKRTSRSRNTKHRSPLYNEDSDDHIDGSTAQGSSSGSRSASTARQFKSSFRSWID